MADNPRILELRRRVQADPASMAFAQLAEECRRSGANDEAVGICRAGLAHHPDYLSARVTLGRALVELGKLDDAFTELTIVLATAPDNLPAIRSLAEIHQRRGQMPEALDHYRRALQLAKHDPDLEHAVETIEREVAPAPAALPAAAAPVKIDELFDFDALLTQLGPDVPAEPKIPETPVIAAPSPIESVALSPTDADVFAVLERQLRDTEEQRARDDQARLEEERRQTEQQLEQEFLEQQRLEQTRVEERRLEEQRAEEQRVEQQRLRAEEERRLLLEQQQRLQWEEQQRLLLEQQRLQEEEQQRELAEQRRLQEQQELRLLIEQQRLQEEEQRQLAERQRLHDEEQRRVRDELLAREAEAERRRLQTLQELEDWLAAIAVDRRQQRSA